MATPLTIGQFFLFAFILKYEAAALSIGLSVRPPPATIPIIALQVPGILFLDPDGSLILVLLKSSLCPTIIDDVPEALAIVPLSPTLVSTLLMMVPSGRAFTGRIFPTVN